MKEVIGVDGSVYYFPEPIREQRSFYETLNFVPQQQCCTCKSPEPAFTSRKKCSWCGGYIS